MSSQILKLGGEAMIPYLARLLDIAINNATIPSDWKRHSGSYLQRSDRSLVSNYRQFILCGQQANGTRYSTVSGGNMG
jgi:hypothetical protein